MGRNQEMYVDHSSTRRRRNNRGKGTLGGIVLVLILAVVCGVLAYKISGQYLEDLPAVPTPTPVAGESVSMQTMVWADSSVDGKFL